MFRLLNERNAGCITQSVTYGSYSQTLATINLRIFVTEYVGTLQKFLDNFSFQVILIGGPFSVDSFFLLRYEYNFDILNLAFNFFHTFS